ncbi:LysR family transcriptional regulator [Veronia nyctiphanis]|uniref:LysR family transcriptional regulator n=1 Tax=Veronia nyctiphanis TaxID=1278244 RepID=A0A4Q0Z0A1_9GAMM|nr:LysR family transcriptional regulator [Veronia nyctiphanis]RXJ74831.1 LysR family transcriptional regulator [Veronia nyctiphanis]
MKLAGTDLRLLKVFDAVVRHHGFAAAQAELNVSQSTISNHISVLEERLGATLCQRGRGGFSLTEKGKIVFAATERLFGAMAEFDVDVTAIKGKLVGELKIGVVDCLVSDPENTLSAAISRFKTRPNDVLMTVKQLSPQELQEHVLAGEFDIGIGSFPHKIDGLSYEPLYQEQHGLFCGSTHPLFDLSDESVSLDELQHQEFVGRHYWRDSLHHSFGFNRITASVYQIEPQLMLILSGKYIGFLPLHYASSWVDAGHLRQLFGRRIGYSCSFDLIIKKGFQKTSLVETFLEDMRASQQS